MEKMLEEGSKNIKCSHLKHPINDTNNPPIQKTDKGKVYSCVFTMDKSHRPKCMASKHPCSKHYTIIVTDYQYHTKTPFCLISVPPCFHCVSPCFHCVSPCFSYITVTHFRLLPTPSSCIYTT